MVKGTAWNARWHGPVPAYRLACFRMAIAFTTAGYGIPSVARTVWDLASSSFRYPTVPWMGGLAELGPPAAALGLLGALVASVALFVGVCTRLSAAVLVAFYGLFFLLDPAHFAHHRHYHVLLLLPFVFARDGMSLRGVLRPDDASATVVAWPERLVMAQTALMFLHTGMDKVFSPAWGWSGLRFASLDPIERGFALGWATRLNAWLYATVPGLLSPFVIALELGMASLFVLERARSLAAVACLAFAAYLELALAPSLFAWDLAAVALLYLPVADRAWGVPFRPGCPTCERRRRWVARLDWLRRTRWIELDEDSHGEAGTLVDPRGRVLRGFVAVRAAIPLFATCWFLAIAGARFGSKWLAALGLPVTQDLAFWIAGPALLLWFPGAARVLGPSFDRVARTLGSGCGWQR